MSIHVNQLQDLAKLIQVELPALGPVEVSATVSGNLATLGHDGMEITGVNLLLDDKNLTVNGTGSFVGIPLDIKGDMQLDIKAPDTDELLRVVGVNRSLAGQLHIKAKLHAENKLVDMSLQQAQFESSLFNGHMSGTVTDILDSALATIDIDIEAPDMSLVTQLSGQGMPPEWGPISGSGQLVGSRGQYAIDDIVAKISGNSTATAKGSIASLMPFDDMHLDVDVNLFTLAETSAFTVKPLPDIGPISGDGAVVWENGELSLIGAKATYDGSLGAAVVTGKIDDLIEFDKVRLKGDADLPDFKALDLFTGFTMPAVDRVIVSTDLISTEAKDLSARNLSVTARKNKLSVSAEGSVDSIIKNNAILDLKLTTKVGSIKQLEALVDNDLPDVGPASASANLSGSGQDIKLADVEITLNDALLSGNVSSDVGNLNRIDMLSFDVDLETVSAKDTLAKFGISSDVNEPATLSSKVLLDVSKHSVKLDDARLTMSKNKLTGELNLLNITDPETRSQIAGSINLKEWNTMQARHPPMLRDSKLGKPASSEKLLSDIPLPLSFIARNDLSLKIQIDELTSDLFDISDATLDLNSENGLLTVGPFSGMVNQGQADFHMSIDTTQNPADVSLTVDLENFDLTRAGLLQSTNFIEHAGGTTAKIKLIGRGDSVADILGSANGEGGVYIDNVVLKQGMLHVLSSDLLDQLVDAINPSKQQSKQTRLICSVLVFEIKDGTLNTPTGFAVDLDKFSIHGNANIDFSDESIDVVIDSKPKKGLGFSFSRFVNLIKIDGQLAAPKLSLSKTGVLRLGASVVAAAASGGISLLAEGLWHRRHANSDICAQALGK